MNEWLFLKDWVNCKYNEMKSNLISRESIHVYSDLSCYMYSVLDLILWRLSCRACTVEKVSIQPSGVEPWVHLFSQNLCNYHPWQCGWYLFFLCESVCVSSWRCPWDTCCRGNYYKGGFGTWSGVFSYSAFVSAIASQTINHIVCFLSVCLSVIMSECNSGDACCSRKYHKGGFDYFDACLYGCLWIDLVTILQHFVTIKMFWTSHYGAVFSFWGGVALVFIDRMMNSVYREIMIETIKIVGLTEDKAMES